MPGTEGNGALHCKLHGPQDPRCQRMGFPGFSGTRALLCPGSPWGVVNRSRQAVHTLRGQQQATRILVTSLCETLLCEASASLTGKGLATERAHDRILL